ncbi:MAG: SDR family NAD(P)-dependent oxidoreductase [Kiritimatiellia bacterium]
MKSTDPLFDLTGKVAVITGGGGVICGAFARELGRRGARVAVLDRAVDFARKVVADIEAAGAEAVAVACDVLDLASIRAAADTVVQAFGRVDILINGAGGNKKEATTGPGMSFFDIPADALRFVIDLNLLGSVLPSQVFGKLMADQGDGVILNISSMNSFRRSPRSSATPPPRRDQQLHAVAQPGAHRAELLAQRPRQRAGAGVLRDRAEQVPAADRIRRTHRSRGRRMRRPHPGGALACRRTCWARWSGCCRRGRKP